MNIRIATTDSEITACCPVMRELRPHVAEEDFLSRIRAQEESGYVLAYVEESFGPVAVAGFRVGESLGRGRFLYVDDLVTLSTHRSKGYGAALLSWLEEYAREKNCGQLHLDSGVEREDAHRFYRREGMEVVSFHFRKAINPPGRGDILKWCS
jgi:GNAT superfamily N-acetyltransferase